MNLYGSVFENDPSTCPDTISSRNQSKKPRGVSQHKLLHQLFSTNVWAKGERITNKSETFFFVDTEKSDLRRRS